MPPTASTSVEKQDQSRNDSSTNIPIRLRRGSRVNYAILANQGKSGLVTAKLNKFSSSFGNVDQQHILPKLKPCKVVLEKLSKSQLLEALTGLNHAKPIVGSVRKQRARSEVLSRRISSAVPADRFSNVTRRSKPRKNENSSTSKAETEKKRHTTSIIEESNGSIIPLNDSIHPSEVSHRSTRNIENLANKDDPPPLRRRASHDDVTEVQTNIASQAPTDSKTRRRTASKRNHSTIGPAIELAVSPPKKVAEESISIVELSVGAEGGIAPENVPSSDHQPVVTEAAKPPAPVRSRTVSKSTASKKDDSNPFGMLIVSVKRIAPALTEHGLQRLKHPELDATQDARADSRPSHENGRTSGIGSTRRPHRLTFSTKPQIVISAPTTDDSKAVEIEQAIDLKANKLAPEVDSKRGISLKHARRVKLSAMPLVIEEENESIDDVYDFLSSTQPNEASPKQRARKPKQARQETKPGKPSKRKATVPKTTGSQMVRGINPFGCNKKKLARVIKQIGGGPVKSPATVDYVINLELPKTPLERRPVQAPIRAVADELATDVSMDVPIIPKRAVNPSVQRLKNGGSVLPLTTSTPHMDKSAVSVTPNTPTHNPASPWRLQNDELILPRTSYFPRNKEMLPTYDSFCDTNEHVPSPGPAKSAPSLITERRKPVPTKPSLLGSAASPHPPEPPALTDDFAGDIVSEKSFREIERMYAELKATSDMSEKLITVMRRYKSRLANDPTSPPQARREYEANMKEACTKLKQWYDRSIKSFKRSLHIINRIQVATDTRATACPSPLSFQQQRTVETFNNSTTQFRAMIDELQEAMNDSNVENHTPPKPVSSDRPSKAMVPQQPHAKASDVIALPDRTKGTHRNPLGALNFVPLPQRTSPLMSPLAKSPPGGVDKAKENAPISTDANIRRELRYENDKEAETIVSNVKPRNEELQSSNCLSPAKVPEVQTNKEEPLCLSPEKVPEVAANEEEPLCLSPEKVPEVAANEEEPLCLSPEKVPEVAANEELLCLSPEKVLKVAAIEEVVELFDNTTLNNEQDNDQQDEALDNNDNAVAGADTNASVTVDDYSKDLFGFDDDSQEPQVTLPIHLNISTETLKQRLEKLKHLVPRQPIFRQQPTTSGLSAGGPTRLPVGFWSPAKRFHTLCDFVASTPRINKPPAAKPSEPLLGETRVEAPDVSEIEHNQTELPQPARTTVQDTAPPEVVLFGTPGDGTTLNRSALHRTYARVPRRRKKINIYLANLGLDDDDDEDEIVDEAEVQELSDDTDAEGAQQRTKKTQKKKARRKPKPVEQTKEFKQFVDSFNSMCEEVEKFPVIIE